MNLLHLCRRTLSYFPPSSTLLPVSILSYTIAFPTILLNAPLYCPIQTYHSSPSSLQLAYIDTFIILIFVVILATRYYSRSIRIIINHFLLPPGQKKIYCPFDQLNNTSKNERYICYINSFLRQKCQYLARGSKTTFASISTKFIYLRMKYFIFVSTLPPHYFLCTSKGIVSAFYSHLRSYYLVNSRFFE